MTPFERLHPALKHHVVNSLGWKDLRPFQQAVIDPVLAGKHLLILAPTAGGKTEGALFPVLSRMLTEGWGGLSVLYVCPIKALLEPDARLDRYCTLLGWWLALWHGDIAAGRKKAILRLPARLPVDHPRVAGGDARLGRGSTSGGSSPVCGR